MAQNKNALLRYQVLDRCFSDSKKNYTLEDLIDAVNDTLNDVFNTTVSIRQIQEDIRFMRERESYNASIIVRRENRKYYYEYADKDFSIFKNMLSIEDLNNLRSTIDMLSKYRGLANNSWIEEVISNLEYRCGIKANKENIVSFEQNEQLKGLEFLSDLIDAADSHTPLRIYYRTYKGKETKTIVHPYHLKQFNNRWFLFGLEETEKGNRITNKALDRIIKLGYPDTQFIPNTEYDFATYFDDVVGVTVPYKEEERERLKILLQFDEARFPYIVSKPLHPSQKIIDEECRMVTIEVIPNNELDSLILSYGPQVKVIEPMEYRTRIVQRIKEASSIYEELNQK